MAVELAGFAMDDPIADLYGRHRRSVQPESRAVAAVLEAVAELLREEGIAPSPTAVFAATMSSLERADAASSPEQTSAMLTVLGAALEHAPTAPILSRVPASMKVLMAVGKASQESQHALRGVVHCVGLLVATLRDAPSDAIVLEQWSHCAKAFSAISNLCVDARPKVRKQAAASVAHALRAIRGTPAAEPAGAAFASVAVKAARAPEDAAHELSRTRGAAGAKAAEREAHAAATEALHLLGALKTIVGEIAEPSAGATAKAVTRLLDLHEPLLTQHACDVLMTLFAPTGASAAAAKAALAGGAVFGAAATATAASAAPASETADAARTASDAIAPLASAAALESARRPTLAISLTRAHCAAVRRLHELDPSGAGAKALPAACHDMVKALNAAHEGVAMEAARSLSALIAKCVDANMVREGIKAMARAKAQGRDAATVRPPPVVGVANALKASLGFRYRAAWPAALPVVAAAFDRLGAAAGPILGGCLEALGEMGAHAEGLACRAQLMQCVASAVAALGPEQALATLPLRLEEGIDAEIRAKEEIGGEETGGLRAVPEEDAMDVATGGLGAELDASTGGNVAGAAGARLWLVPLLRQSLRGARLSYFAEELLPTARRLGERAARAKRAGRAFEAQRCAAAEAALWSLLPAFCRWPEDAADAFPGLAPSLGSALGARADLRGPLTEALRRLVRQALAARQMSSESASECARDPGGSDAGEGSEGSEDPGGSEANRDDDALLEDRPEWFDAARANAQCEAVAKYARNFLPILFNLFVAAPPERRGELAATVGCFARVTDAATLGGFFRTVLRKLVKVTADAPDAPDALEEGGDTRSARRCTFMDLALAMVPGLDSDARDLVFKAARPAATEKDAAVQKRAYKLLAALCGRAPGNADDGSGSWLARNRDAVEAALADGAAHCAPAARRYRLRCVASVLPSLMEREAAREGPDAEGSEGGGGDGSAAMDGDGTFAVLLGELIVATKESNARTRKQAFELLVDIPREMERRAGGGGAGGRVGGSASAGGGGGGMLGAWLAAGDDSGDEANDSGDEAFDAGSDSDAMEGVTNQRSEVGVGVRKFFMTVLAGVVGATPTMQSASVMALARLLYEFSAALVSSVPELLPAVFALMARGDREVVKACLGFVKVAAVRLPQADLAAQLPALVPALLAPCDDEDGFNRFRSKTRVVVERLVKRCGWKAVEDVVPPAHRALIAHMKRSEVRSERRRKAASEFGGDRRSARGGAATDAGRSAATRRGRAWNDADVFSDDDGTAGPGGTSRGRGGGRSGSVAGGIPRGAYSLAPTSRREAGGGGPRSAAAAHALRAAGGARLPGSASGDAPLDLLDESAMRRRMLDQGGGRRDDADDGRAYARGEGGKLVIREESENFRGGKRKRGEEDVSDDDGGGSVGARSNVSRRTAKTNGTMRSGRTARTGKGRGGSVGGRTERSGKTARGSNKAHGAEAYRAKKGAKGDVRSKSRKLEPYAYWPLDPKLLNRRASKRASAKEGLGRVVRNAKAAGIFHGQKARDEEARK